MASGFWSQALIMFIYCICVFLVTPFIIRTIYRIHRQLNLNTYHKVRDKSEIENSEYSETVMNKVIENSYYYAIITFTSISTAYFISVIGSNLSFAASFNISRNDPLTLVFLEAFLLIMFSSVRITSLLHTRSSYDFQDLGDKLNGYLFSLMLSMYFVSVYQIGSTIIFTDLLDFYVEIPNIILEKIFIALIMVFILPVTIALITEYILFYSVIPARLMFD